MTAPPVPLSGTVVVSLEQAVSAPLCTRLLADLGARVIKIERPDGGDFTREYDDVVHGMSAHFVWLNRGKESVALDLKQSRDREILHRLLDTADALVSNLAPGATARLGLDGPALSVAHPRLISLEISGYGAGGPLSGKRAYDLLVHAETGSAGITGGPDAPAKPGPPFADAATGLFAANAVLAALYRRRDTGSGTSIEISMFDVMAEMMGYPLTWSAYTGSDQQRVGLASAAVAPYAGYPTSDGRVVVLGTTNDAEWQRLAAGLLGRPDLAADERFRRNVDRVRHRELLDREIGGWCATRALADIQAAADEAGIGNAVLRRPTEVIEHPHLVARDRWQTVASPVGPVRGLRPPASFDGVPLCPGPVPALGEHTRAVLEELGVRSPDPAEPERPGDVP